MKHAHTLMVALTAVAALAACAKDETATTDSAAGAAAAPPPVTPAAPALTDANIVYILDQANMADSAMGKVADTKATDPEVKRFARMMMSEHHALRLAGENLAKKLGVTPAAPPADDTFGMLKAMTDSLTAQARGKTWDKAYIDHEVMMHQTVLDKANQALSAAQNAELKTLIEGAAPVIQKHLDMAKALQTKLQ